MSNQDSKPESKPKTEQKPLVNYDSMDEKSDDPETNDTEIKKKLDELRETKKEESKEEENINKTGSKS